MRVLCVNCGSSTLKFDLLDKSDAGDAPERIASGLVDHAGAASTLSA